MSDKQQPQHNKRFCRVRRLPLKAPEHKPGILKSYGRNAWLWPNGAVINWCFVPDTALDNKRQREIVVAAWKKWADAGINLTFQQLEWSDRDKCQVRIAFRDVDENFQQEGSYS